LHHPLEYALHSIFEGMGKEPQGYPLDGAGQPFARFGGVNFIRAQGDYPPGQLGSGHFFFALPLLLPLLWSGFTRALNVLPAVNFTVVAAGIWSG